MSDLLSRYQRDGDEDESIPINRITQSAAEVQDEVPRPPSPEKSAHDLQVAAESSANWVNFVIKGACLIILLLAVILACRLIVGLGIVPSRCRRWSILIGLEAQVISNIMSGRCSDNPAAIDNVREFDSTVKEINFNIPYKVEVDPKQWIEGKAHFLKSKF